ncbi:MAG: hypothetical protein IPQ07_18395 [Myxococcales bacterium]|nr:hypothetical protein [Myxococcales bacterium]
MTQQNGSVQSFEMVSEQEMMAVDGGELSGWGWAGGYALVVGMACPPCAGVAAGVGLALFVIDAMTD